MAIEDYYHTLTCLRYDYMAVDKYGDSQPTSAGSYQFPGLIGKPNSTTAISAAQRNVTIDARLYTLSKVPIRVFDVIIDSDGKRYTVASEPRDAARRGHHIEADLTLNSGGGTT